MANQIKVKRGLRTNLPNLALGEFGFTTDSEELYIGGNNGNKQFKEDKSSFIDVTKPPFPFLPVKILGQTITSNMQILLDNFKNIFIPNGTYEIDEILSLSEGHNIKMESETILKRMGSQYTIFTNGKMGDNFSGYNGNGNIVIDGGVLEVNGVSDTTNGMGIVIGHSSNILIKNVTIKNVYNLHHIEVNSSKNVIIQNCVFDGFTHDGSREFSEAIQIDMAKNNDVFPLFGSYDGTLCNNVIIDKCYFNNVGAGIGTHVTDIGVFHSDIYINNCKMENLLHNGISGLIMNNLSINNVRVENVGKYGVQLTNCFECSLNNVVVDEATDNSLFISNSDKIAVVGSTIKNGSSNGVTIFSGSENINIVNSVILNNAGLGVNIESDNNIIENTLIKGNGSHGIYLHETSCKYNTIKDCEITTNGSHGVLISVSASENTIKGCFIERNNQNDNGSNNIIIVSDSDKNWIINNIVRKGTLTVSPIYGLYIALGCDFTRRFLNDFSDSGVTSNVQDLSTNSITNGIDIE